MNRKKNLWLTILTAVFLAGIFCFPGNCFRFESYAAAAAKLETPEPYQSGTFTVSWEHVAHAASYEVQLSLRNDLEEKTVSRTLLVNGNKVDLTLFAAECTVSVSVRAVPSASSSRKYRNSGWGSCEEKIFPADDNAVSGYAGASGKQYYLADADGRRMSGWKYVNHCWFYFDPANSSLSSIGWAVINGADYYFNEYGQMQTGWVTWNQNRYFMNPSDGKMVTGWFQVTPTQKMYFTETAAEGQPRGSLKKEGSQSGTPAGSGSASPAAPSGQWRHNPDGSWSYYKNGAMIRSGWENVDGFWYWFDGNGIMLTGWQFINSRWYYLEPNKNGTGSYKYGAMWANAVTPDGYTVNKDGCWTQNGVPVAERGNSSGQGSGSGSGREGTRISTCRLNVSSSDMGAGKMMNASVTAASDCKIRSTSFSKAYADWTPGESIAITVELEPGAGYYFTSSTSFSCSGGKVLSQSGGDTVRTVRISYTPVFRLSAPGMVHVTDNYELRWLPANRAKRYKVRISIPDNGSTFTQTVTETSLDLSEFGNPDADTMNIEISSLGPQNSSGYRESEKVTIRDVAEYKNTNPVYGSLRKTDGRLRYTDENGSGIGGWQQLFGNWYHFRKSGYADGPGWYQDETGFWYYFDSEYRMLTGRINDGGTEYFLNDGSVSNVPLGAWVK